MKIYCKMTDDKPNWIDELEIKKQNDKIIFTVMRYSGSNDIRCEMDIQELKLIMKLLIGE